MNDTLKYSFTILRITRENVMAAIENMTFEQITTVPDGFSNSILWNVVHLFVTPHLLFYGLSNNEINQPKSLIGNFRKGSSGENSLPQEEFEEIKNNFISSVDQLENDFEMLSKTNFNKYTTSYNITLTSIEEVANFNNSHEAMHYGIILQLKKFV